MAIVDALEYVRNMCADENALCTSTTYATCVRTKMHYVCTVRMAIVDALRTLHVCGRK